MVVGTSAGAMTAAMFAVGYVSHKLEEFFKEDVYAIMNGESVVDIIPHLSDSLHMITSRLYRFHHMTKVMDKRCKNRTKRN